jgi:L-alanine-DL-glutamate epimerase-like enolase superfamily enzyme
MRPSLTVRAESWPLKQPFIISRGVKSTVEVVVAEIAEDGRIGRGESVPYARYGESVQGIVSQIDAQRDAIADGIDAQALKQILPAGAARTALDCALWDLAAKRSGKRAWELAGVPAPAPVLTFDTLAIDSPARMGAAVHDLGGWPLLKIKLDRQDIVERVRAVRNAARDARLIVDANESWDLDTLRGVASDLLALGVEAIEQPLPADADACLVGHSSAIPIIADESCHQTSDLERLAGRYQGVSIKLNKTGGLTEAWRLARTAKEMGFRVMISCMNSTSLAVAPAMLLAGYATIVDLDGAKWLARDRQHGLRYADGYVYPPSAELWG